MNTFCRWLFVLMLPGGLTFVACRPGIHRNVWATVFSTEGAVTLERTTGESDAVTSKTRLAVGDGVRTQKNASLYLSFLPGILGQLGDESHLQIVELEVKKDGDEVFDAMLSRVAGARLIHGTLYGTVEAVDIIGSTRSELRVETPAGIITAGPHSLLRVDVNAGATRVLCIGGKVTRQTQQMSPVDFIEAGYWQEWPSSERYPKLAYLDTRSQTEISEGLDAEKKLFSLQKEKLQSLAPWLHFKNGGRE